MLFKLREVFWSTLEPLFTFAFGAVYVSHGTDYSEEELSAGVSMALSMMLMSWILRHFELVEIDLGEEALLMISTMTCRSISYQVNLLLPVPVHSRATGIPVTPFSSLYQLLPRYETKQTKNLVKHTPYTYDPWICMGSIHKLRVPGVKCLTL